MALEDIRGLIKGLEGQESWQAQRQFRLVLLHWPKAVGFAVARKTRPVSIHRGTLHVATATAAWAQSLAYERFKILQKLNRHQSHPLRNIRFSTAYWNQSQQSASSQARQAAHPSLVQRSQQQTLAEPKPTTPDEAFQRWARTLQAIQTHQAICPRCQCHCPPGELDRWKCCSLCAAKQWH